MLIYWKKSNISAKIWSTSTRHTVVPTAFKILPESRGRFLGHLGTRRMELWGILENFKFFIFFASETAISRQNRLKFLKTAKMWKFDFQNKAFKALNSNSGAEKPGPWVQTTVFWAMEVLASPLKLGFFQTPERVKSLKTLCLGGFWNWQFWVRKFWFLNHFLKVMSQRRKLH